MCCCCSVMRRGGTAPSFGLISSTALWHISAHRWRSPCHVASAAKREQASGGPRCEAVKVEGCGGGKVLQARLNQAAAARLAQAKGARLARRCPQRRCAAHTGACPPPCPRAPWRQLRPRVRGPRVRATAPPPGSGLALRARPGAAGARRAGSAVGGTEPPVDDAARPAMPGTACPKDTLLFLGAAGDLAIPIHREIGQGGGVARAAALPGHVAAPGIDGGYPVLGAGSNEMVGADASRIHQVLGRGQALCGALRWALCMSAGMVSAWIIRRGFASSQVLAGWTMQIVHLAACLDQNRVNAAWAVRGSGGVIFSHPWRAL